jgi:hypothetical protein
LSECHAVRDDEADRERDDHSLCQLIHGAVYLHAMTLRLGTAPWPDSEGRP